MTTILVVDDEPELREIVAESLILAGYVVHEANSAAAALIVLAAQPDVAVLLTDIRMPPLEHDGVYLADRAHRLYPGLAIVLMTGYAVNGWHWPVLHKPFRMAQMQDTLSAALAGQSGCVR